MPNDSQEYADRWNVGRLITWTTDFLKRKGSESPRLDAEVLLAHVLRWDRVKLYTRYGDEVDAVGLAEYRELVRRRAQGTPVAYLVGRKEFYSIKLAVSPAVLIPRPDSEFVIVEFLAAFKEIIAPRIVDVGTGSGCLALACVHAHPSAEALDVARRNAATLGLSERVEFRLGNLLGPVANEAPFDAILSNPPYIRSDVIPLLDPGVRDYEPHLALDGGSDGLRVVTPLIEQAVALLKPGGLILLEIGSDQEKAVRSLLEAQADLKVSSTVRDHAHHPRVLRATKRI